MENIILSSINKDQLVDEIIDKIKTVLREERKSALNEKKNWTTKDVALYCKVSTVTVHEWTKRGILTKYKIGNRVFYNKKEVLAAIHKIEH